MRTHFGMAFFILTMAKQTESSQQPQSNGMTLKATKEMFDRETTVAKFQKLLGNKAPGFITSVMQVVSTNTLLVKADPVSIFQAAAMAASMDLPINNNLGFAYIVPYGGKAQFQVGWKGFLQLAQRSGQFKTISASPIYAGQIAENNPLTGIKFDFSIPSSGDPVGYAAYFSLLNGFEKTLYMTAEEARKHGAKFSKTFNSGTWNSNFEAMALKTVLKLLLSKYAPLSIEMQRAVVTDQAVIKDAETEDIDYVDNEPLQIAPEEARAIAMIEDCLNLQDLEGMRAYICGEDSQQAFNSKYHELGGK